MSRNPRLRSIGRWFAASGAACASLLLAASLQAADAAPSSKPDKFRDFAEVTKGLQKFEGLFNLYRTNDTLYAEIKPLQFDQPILAPITIARGMAQAGQPLNFGDEWVLVFHREGDKVQLIRRNIHFKAPERTPLEKAVKQNYSDSVLMALPIVSINPGSQAVLIDFAQIFLTDFADLRIGSMDRNRSSWHKIKAFPNNLEIEVEATFSGRSSGGSFYDGVVDGRGMTLVIHYSLAKLPDSSYKPRMADNRVGYFISAMKDFGSTDPDTQFVRQVNRWRLEKADPKAKLSAPKRQLVWWVEDNVPHEYRPYVEEGILEWNKAFEKIGFKNAIGVRWQNERDDFDPEDINYCTFRWITTANTFAMSGLRANPLTGELIDGDVIFDASWIRHWKDEYALLIGQPAAAGGAMQAPLAVAEIISPIMAAKQGFGLPFPIPGREAQHPVLNPGDQPQTRLVPGQWSPLQLQLSQRYGPNKFTACQFAAGKHQEFNLAAIAMAAAGKGSADGKLPEEFLGQAIKEVVMHEVGHSLGLRHNFRASCMLTSEQLNDTAITKEKGMAGSVMDYNPINVVRKGEKQGDYASTTIGPYDYWAIEYAYKPIDGDEAAELKKIAARSPEGELSFATDEDMYLNDDPYVNTYDLGSDPLKYGQERMALAAELLKDLDDSVIKEGESWNRLRTAFSTLLSQYGNATYLASAFIGGQSVTRDFRGPKDSRDPIMPIPGDKQREALKTLTENILSDKAFSFSPSLLRRLKGERWYHWGSEFLSGGSVDFPVYNRILAIQRIVLNQCFDPNILSRIQTQELQSDEGKKPLTMAEVFRTLTDGIWTEVPADGKAEKVNCSVIRRNLQRDHVRRLCTMVLGAPRSGAGDAYGYVVFLGNSNVPADAKSLARLHLTEINDRIKSSLDNKEAKMDDSTKAHLVECRQRINKVLESSYTSNDF